MIDVKSVCKSFDDKNMILDNISFHVEGGSIHGLVGPNGSGKTTLIKCMMGIYQTTSGEVLYDGKPVFDNPEVKKRIGYVADENIFFEEYTPKKMVKYYNGIYESFDEKEFEDLNKIFKIPMNVRIGNLSKGQKMRLSFVLNMAMNPDVMILDEPTSGLDAIAKKEFFDKLIARVEGQEVTVVISSHNLGDLEKICDTITMFDKDNKVEVDTVDSIKDSIGKYQVVFKNGDGAGFMKDERILEYSTLGSVYTVIWKYSDPDQVEDEALEYFNKKGADLAERIDITLEESFVYLNMEGESR